MKKKHHRNLTCDVAIVGGGLSGLTLACLLGDIPKLRIAVIERAPPEHLIRADDRTTAISYGSSQILEQAGIWKNLKSLGCPINEIEILDGDSPVLLNFLKKEVEEKSFGWIVPNSDIRAALMGRIKKLTNVDHLTPESVRDFAVNEKSGKVSIALESGKTLEAALVVGADGRNSFVREWMDVPVREWSYNQRAVICTILHQHPHHNIAVEHFYPDGPFAILPMADNTQGRHRSSLVFTEHKKIRGSGLMEMNAQEFQNLVQEKFPARYGCIEIEGSQRKAFPLSLIHAARYIGPRMALVADAAHAIHPVAGQGLNLGFQDLKQLSFLINEAYAAGKDIGALELLESYQRKRRPENMAMVAVTDGLVRLFSNRSKTVGLLRRAGLKAVSRLPTAKKFFMRRAMGE